MGTFEPTPAEAGERPPLDSLMPPQAPCPEAEELIENGYTYADIGPEREMGVEIKHLFNQADQYFDWVEEQDNHGPNVFRWRKPDDSPLIITGLRRQATADESAEEGYPDLCDSISLMNADLDKLPPADRERFLEHPLIVNMMAMKAQFDVQAQRIMDGIATAYGRPDRSADVSSHSWLQAFRYPPNTGIRVFRQEPHDDGQLLTMAFADELGLELLNHDDSEIIEVVQPSLHRAAVIPGSILTDMTGGEGSEHAIPGQRHQVRNISLTQRHALIYFVNPDVTQWIYPFVDTPYNEGFNIAQRANDSQIQFGMAPYEAPESIPKAA